MNKQKRDSYNVLKILGLGLLTGFVLSGLSRWLVGSFDSIQLDLSFIGEEIIWIQIFLVIILLIPALVLLQRAKERFDKANQSLNLEDDSAEIKGNRILFYSKVFNRLYTVLSFVGFGLVIEIDGLHVLWSALIFLLFLVINVLIEIQSIRLIQQRDPMKKGDPTSMKFNKEYFSSLDEAEKVQVYQVSYHTNQFMEIAMMIIFVGLLMMQRFIEIGIGPILILGFIWFLQSIVQLYYTRKFQK